MSNDFHPVKYDPHPLRILHIGKYFPPHRGGMETFLRDLIIQQVHRGDEVLALVHSSERRLIDKTEHDPLGFTVRRCARWFTAIFSPISPFFGLSLYQELKRFKPETIHCHLPNLSAFWLLLLPAASSIPWVIRWQSDVLPSQHSFGLRLFYIVYRQFERSLLSRCDEILVSSPPYLSSSEPLRPFLSKCRIDPLFIDKNRIPKKYRSTPKRALNSIEGLRVLCVGRLTYYKGFDSAIRAFAELPNCFLQIAGDGQEYDNLAALIIELGLSNQVELLGEVDDAELWEAYAWCDVLCLPSIERTEAFGLVILEAAALDKPSLVADTAGSGMSWLIQQIKPKGMHFRAGDPKDLANQLKKLAIQQIE